jgi:hypothetical protein
MFIIKDLNIEAKRSNLTLYCESGETNWFILKIDNIEAKRTGSIVILHFKKLKKSEVSFFLNERQKTKGFESKLLKFCHS